MVLHLQVGPKTYIKSCLSFFPYLNDQYKRGAMSIQSQTKIKKNIDDRKYLRVGLQNMASYRIIRYLLKSLF